MEKLNTLKTLLHNVVATEYTHKVWLYCLSYLEFIGYRKIVKALPYEVVKGQVVHHLSDEIQHSFMFKQLANKVFQNQEVSEEVHEQLQKISEAYFQSLDQGIKDYLQNLDGKYDPYRSYAYVTYIIEKRAMKTYPLYLNFLETQEEASLKIVVQKIIRDEADHLKYIQELINEFAKIPGLVESDMMAIEDRCFHQFSQDFSSHFLQ